MSGNTGPERHGMKGWGTKLGADLQEPKTMPEAQLLAIMSIADRMFELITLFQDIQARLTRIEVFLEETVPTYSQTSAYSVTKQASDDLLEQRLQIISGELRNAGQGDAYPGTVTARRR